ncbi:MAG: hypothetical protein ABJA67_12830 [Chthonomonadales bacterium]
MAIFNSVPIIASLVQVHSRERFPDNEEDDITLSTVPDLVNADMGMTSIIQIGAPTVEEYEYTGDTSTHITFSYPITFDLSVKDKWNDVTLEFQNSSDLAMAIYMRARTEFKKDRTLGFTNCSHEYLQQENAGVVPDEESGGRLHMADWSLTVKCTSVVV